MSSVIKRTALFLPLVFLLSLCILDASFYSQALGRDRLGADAQRTSSAVIASPDVAVKQGALGPQGQLYAEQHLTSADGRFSLTMQVDGNLVLYRNGVGVLWDTGTAGSGAIRLAMQSDGNLVLYTAAGVAVWASNTAGRGCSLHLQTDSNLIIYCENIGMVWRAPAALDALQEYAQACDATIGVTVPDFNCDAMTAITVPTDHLTPTNATYPNGSCDRPNQLNQECDKGSRFQVLTNNQDAVVVAHCRKQGHSDGQFGDIAVIQYNRNNGATCFYQALGNLSGDVKAPSKGLQAWPWLLPAQTAGIKCGGCHDNGPLIRSPYLTQITGANMLPGAGDTTFNRDQPYAFVGADFASWKAYKVEVANNLCNSCHRMGVSNVGFGQERGTALEFGMRATADWSPLSPDDPNFPRFAEKHKNPHSLDSPLWMTPGQLVFSQTNANFAQAIRNCALRLNENPLPNAPDCKITQFTSIAAPPTADVGVSASAAPDPVAAGAELVYTVDIVNNGPGPANAVRLTTVAPSATALLQAPAGCVEAPAGTLTCELGALASGATRQVAIRVRVAGDLVFNAGGPTTITAHMIVANPASADPVPQNDTADVTTQVVAVADLAIVSFAAVDPPAQILVEQPLAILLRKVITNLGPSAPIDAALTKTATAPPDATVTPAGSTKAEPKLELNEQRTVDETFTVECHGYSHHAFLFNNRIDPAHPADTDPQPSNNQADVNLDIECVVPIKIVIAPNFIHTVGNMPIPVAIFALPGGDPGLPLAFDPATIDPATVRFGPHDLIWTGGGGAAEYHSTDDHNVGTRRLRMYHFRQKSTGLQPGDHEACIKGTWRDTIGNPHTFFGCDQVAVW